MTIKSRVERLEKKAKSAGNDQSIHKNYTVKQTEKSIQWLNEVILEEIKSGRGIINCREANISKDPLIHAQAEKIKKDLIARIERKESMKKAVRLRPKKINHEK